MLITEVGYLRCLVADSAPVKTERLQASRPQGQPLSPLKRRDGSKPPRLGIEHMKDVFIHRRAWAQSCVLLFMLWTCPNMSERVREEGREEGGGGLRREGDREREGG
jgi:hypothetical protein